MSFFRKLVGVAAPIVGGIFGGPVGAALGSAVGGSVQKRAAAPLAMPGPGPTGYTFDLGSSLMPVGARAAVMPTMGSLPALGRGVAGTIGYGAGMVIGRSRTIARAAGALCLKHPQWCSTIGGTAAIAALMESGQMPVPKRRRGRGLTPRDLRSFRRVASLVRGFCPTVRRIPSRAIHARKTGIIHA